MDIKQLPQVITNFIAASNKPDPESFINCFSKDSIVEDESKEHVGKPAIKQWSEKYHFGANVTLEPRSATQEDDGIVVTCKVDGDFDKTGLPDPFLLDYHFQITDGRIIKLFINERDMDEN